MAKRFYWELVTDGEGGWRNREQRALGEHLAGLRRGAGREPGSVPAMWRHHAVTIDDDWLARHHHSWAVPREFSAEHHALTLYGFHQQSVAEPMHRREVGLGTAMLRLRQSGRHSADAVDRRFNTAATADSVEELAEHLRRLIALLRGVRQPLDYTRLFHDLASYHLPGWQGRVRRRWGLQYYAARADQSEPEATEAVEDPRTA